MAVAPESQHTAINIASPTKKPAKATQCFAPTLLISILENSLIADISIFTATVKANIMAAPFPISGANLPIAIQAVVTAANIMPNINNGCHTSENLHPTKAFRANAKTPTATDIANIIPAAPTIPLKSIVLSLDIAKANPTIANTNPARIAQATPKLDKSHFASRVNTANEATKISIASATVFSALALTCSEKALSVLPRPLSVLPNP